MFLRQTRARSGDQVHTYAQIVESYRDKGKPRHKVIASLGRVDKLDPDSMARLIESLASLTDRVAVVLLGYGTPDSILLPWLLRRSCPTAS